jgi:hypothetical protein
MVEHCRGVRLKVSTGVERSSVLHVLQAERILATAMHCIYFTFHQLTAQGLYEVRETSSQSKPGERRQSSGLSIGYGCID